MTSSCQGPTTVRPGIQNYRTASGGQKEILHASSAPLDSKYGTEYVHQSPYDCGQLPPGYHTQNYWPTQDVQNKDGDPNFFQVLSPGTPEVARSASWLGWSSTSWENQAAPGADEWQSPDTFTRLQADQPVISDLEYTDNWLHQQSYPCPQVLPDQETFWTQPPTWPHQNSHNEQCHGSFIPTSQLGHVNTQYPGMNASQSESTMSRYAFSSPETQSTHDSFFPGNGTSLWYVAAVNSDKAGMENTQQRYGLDEAIPPYRYTSEVGWHTSLPEASPPTIEASLHHASTSPEWSTQSLIQTNAPPVNLPSSDLIPDPPKTMIDPPDEDMNPLDRSLLPQRRELKDQNHLYMPRWIRGHGKQREGWCGACRPGRWLSLKRSTYWYHKNFCHGITTMGTSFPRPTSYRQARDEKSLEGLCRSCNKWIALSGNKKHQTQTSWFRHAYKCNSPSKTALFC